jgi:hypothetical protein
MEKIILDVLYAIKNETEAKPGLREAALAAIAGWNQGVKKLDAVTVADKIYWAKSEVNFQTVNNRFDWDHADTICDLLDLHLRLLK